LISGGGGVDGELATTTKLPLESAPTRGWRCTEVVNVLTWKFGPAGWAAAAAGATSASTDRTVRRTMGPPWMVIMSGEP
jgi:hypothetical protein